MKTYRRLQVWEDAMAYTERIYLFLKELPSEERYNLTDQLRRAVISIPLNIAEGTSCDTEADSRRFFWYAYRSTHEVITCLELTQRLNLVRQANTDVECLMDRGDKLAAMIYRLITKLHVEAGKNSSR